MALNLDGIRYWHVKRVVIYQTVVGNTLLKAELMLGGLST
nr:MAG TPA: hypothetical protein [Caudoviricetes sp.]